MIPKIEASWEDIACVLINDIQVISNIKTRCHNISTSCCREALKHWLENANPPATWSNLLEALEQLGLIAARDKMIKNLQKHEVVEYYNTI